MRFILRVFVLPFLVLLFFDFFDFDFETGLGSLLELFEAYLGLRFFGSKLERGVGSLLWFTILLYVPARKIVVHLKVYQTFLPLGKKLCLKASPVFFERCSKN